MISKELILRNALLLRNGLINFCVYNPFDYSFSEEDLSGEVIRLADSDFWSKIKSYTWSCDCKIFFVVDKDSIITGHVYEEYALISNKTWKAFEKIYNYNPYKRTEK